MSKSIKDRTTDKVKDSVASLFADIIKVLLLAGLIALALFLVWFFFDR